MQRSCQRMMRHQGYKEKYCYFVLEDLLLKILSSTFILKSATGLKLDICDKKDERFIF